LSYCGHRSHKAAGFHSLECQNFGPQASKHEYRRLLFRACLILMHGVSHGVTIDMQLVSVLLVSALGDPKVVKCQLEAPILSRPWMKDVQLCQGDVVRQWGFPIFCLLGQKSGSSSRSHLKVILTRQRRRRLKNVHELTLPWIS